MGNAGAEAAAAAGGAAEGGPGAAAEAEAHGAGPSQTSGLAYYNQETAKALAQPGGQVALGVALAIIRVTKPTWNIKQRLVRRR